MYHYDYFMNQSFDNNDYSYKDDFDLYRNVNIPSLFTPVEAYNNGNLFSNLYSQYKNYTPTVLRASNQREKLFLELSQISFAAHELNLYLDMHPDNESMITLFNDYRERANQLVHEYESKYGPLTISSDSLNQTPFAWEKGAWPWEVNSNV